MVSNFVILGHVGMVDEFDSQLTHGGWRGALSMANSGGSGFTQGRIRGGGGVQGRLGGGGRGSGSRLGGVCVNQTRLSCRNLFACVMTPLPVCVWQVHPKPCTPVLLCLRVCTPGKDTNGSQFFIAFKSCRHLDFKHTVFARVVGGLEVLTAMERLQVQYRQPRVWCMCITCMQPGRHVYM